MTAVTIDDAERRTRYAPTVATTGFPVAFPIFNDDDVKVYLDGELTTDWTMESSYEHGISTDAVVRADGDGWVDVVVDIVGSYRPRRTDQFADGRGVPAKDLNLIHNREIATERESYDRLNRSLLVPFGETIGPLPALAARKGMVLAFDEDTGDPVESDLIGAPGDKGWSPQFAVVSDSARRVLQLTAWTGGEGTTPTSDVGKYVGASGLVSAIGDAVDIRGQQGLSGEGTGDMLAANNLSDLADDAVARDNLGLGDLATKDEADLNLGDLAIRDDILFSHVNAAAVASQSDAEAGTAINKLMTPQRVAQAIAALAATGGGLKGIQVFQSGSGTYTPTSGATRAIVLLTGGGGGGGGVTATGDSGGVRGGNGGAGATLLGYIASLTSVSYVVGAGGAAGTPTVAAANGGQTTFGALSANGGNKGNNGNAGGSNGSPGAAQSTTSGGVLTIPGSAGLPVSSSMGFRSHSFWGAGPASDAAGVAPGTGGSGGGSTGSGTATGFAGAAGLIIVIEF